MLCSLRLNKNVLVRRSVTMNKMDDDRSICHESLLEATGTLRLVYSYQNGRVFFKVDRVG
jgi:hypothetical protein